VGPVVVAFFQLGPGVLQHLLPGLVAEQRRDGVLRPAASLLLVRPQHTFADELGNAHDLLPP
jgi:hypothetical protein